MKTFTSETHRFVTNELIENSLDKKALFYLTEIGLPQKIVYQEYKYYQQIISEGNYLILGETKNDQTPHNLVIDLSSNCVFHKWNFEHSTYVFINSSIEQLIQSVFIKDFVINRMIKNQSLGKYNENHEKYANLLEEMLKETDEDTVSKGAWSNLIEEMKLGVI